MAGQKKIGAPPPPFTADGLHIGWFQFQQGGPAKTTFPPPPAVSSTSKSKIVAESKREKGKCAKGSSSSSSSVTLKTDSTIPSDLKNPGEMKGSKVAGTGGATGTASKSKPMLSFLNQVQKKKKEAYYKNWQQQPKNKEAVVAEPSLVLPDTPPDTPPTTTSKRSEDESSSSSSRRSAGLKPFRLVCAKQFRGPYTEEENRLLYGDKCFVVDLLEVDKHPEPWFLWRISESSKSLQKFVPAKFAKLQFHTSTQKYMKFPEGDDDGGGGVTGVACKSQNFHGRFQPVPVVICPQDPHSPESVTIQFPYIDKMVFYSASKYLGQFHKTDHLKQAFVQSLPIFYCKALQMSDDVMDQTIKSRWGPADDDASRNKRDVSLALAAFATIGNAIQNAFAGADKKSNFTQDTMNIIKTYPYHFYTKKKEADENEEGNAQQHYNYCTACPPLMMMRRSPMVKVNLVKKGSIISNTPYDWESLKEKVEQPVVLPSSQEMHQWCRNCYFAARKLHSLYHWRHKMMKITRQNIMKEVANLEEVRKHCPTLEITTAGKVFAALSYDKNWENNMFLDFQVCMAGVEQDEELFGGTAAGES